MTETTLTQKDSSRESIVPEVNEIFTLYYRKGSSVQTINFAVLNTENLPIKEFFTKAIERGRKHCELMRFAFIQVRPLVTDLDWEESKMPL